MPGDCKRQRIAAVILDRPPSLGSLGAVREPDRCHNFTATRAARPLDIPGRFSTHQAYRNTFADCQTRNVPSASPAASNRPSREKAMHVIGDGPSKIGIP